MLDAIDNFVERLASADVLPNVVNHYSYDRAAVAIEQANAIRRENLQLYLCQMVDVRPTMLLVGEAPGYRGCRVTGVPFTNKALLLSQLPIDTDGFQVTEDGDYSRREGSATIMWQTLQHMGVLPLLWNAFPFHPHHPEQPLSNRRPTRHELRIGTDYLVELLELFRPEKVVAVGNCAAESLARLGIPHKKVRHPSHGGKQAFAIQLRALLE